MSKPEFIRKTKDWWHRNKRTIKVGCFCLFAGMFYGFFNGFKSNETLWIEHGYKYKDDSIDGDDIILDEMNCDDPDLIESVNK